MPSPVNRLVTAAPLCSCTGLTPSCKKPVRVSRTARITLDRNTETVHVEEVADREKPPILRAYLKEWAWEVSQFFAGVGADASEADLVRIAPKRPVFRIVP